jgi:hypothetical protein
MAAIPPGARIGEHFTGQSAEAKGIVEFAVSKQTSIGGDPRAMELKLQTAVEIKLESIIIRFTHWVRHGDLVLIRLNY